jgi:hypothetical protein
MERLIEVTEVMGEHAAEVRRLATHVISAIEAIEPEGGRVSSTRLDEALSNLDMSLVSYRSLRADLYRP